MKFRHVSGKEVEAFCWVVDAPEWWRAPGGIKVETTSTTAILTSGGRVEVGDYVVRDANGMISAVPRVSFLSEYAPVAAEEPVTLRGPGEGKSFKQRFWGEWAGKQIILQCKGRAIIIGTLRSFENGFLRIEDAQIKGIKNLARVRTLMVDRDHVGHFHEPGELEQLEFSSKTVFDSQVFEPKAPPSESQV